MSIAYGISGALDGFYRGAKLRKMFDEKKRDDGLRKGLQGAGGLQGMDRVNAITGTLTEYGDPSQILAAQEYQTKARADWIGKQFTSALATGDPTAAISAYDEVNDGWKAGMRQTDNGYELYRTNEQDPTQIEVLWNGADPKEATTFLAKSASPETFYELAKTEQDYLSGQMGLQKDRYSLMKAQAEAAGQPWGFSQNAAAAKLPYEMAGMEAERAGQPYGFSQQNTQIEAQRNILNEGLKMALDARDPNLTRLYEQRLAQFDQQTRGLSGGGSIGYDGIIQSLIGTESSGNPQAQNNAVGSSGRRGHFGLLQFGRDRLDEFSQAVGRPVSPQEFMDNPQLQLQAAQWHFGDIDNFIAENGLDQYIGQTIKGVPITLDGMRAVAHLGGNAGLKKFLTDPTYNPDDGRTKLSDYARKHANASGVYGVTPATANVAQALTKQNEIKFSQEALASIPDAVNQRLQAELDARGLDGTPEQIAALEPTIRQQVIREMRANAMAANRGIGLAPQQQGGGGISVGDPNIVQLIEAIRAQRGG